MSDARDIDTPADCGPIVLTNAIFIDLRLTREDLRAKLEQLDAKIRRFRKRHLNNTAL